MYFNSLKVRNKMETVTEGQEKLTGFYYKYNYILYCTGFER